MKIMDLYCLPFAGGNKYSYREFEKRAPASLNIIPLEYPGRGQRIGEGFLTDMYDVADDLYDRIKDRVDRGNYAIYGHSMGALAAYLLAGKLRAGHHRLPSHLFVTGTTGPSAFSRTLNKRHLLPKDEFIQELKDLDGSPEEILQSDELLEYFEPILRADFKATETYQYRETPPLNIPLTVITGDQEKMTTEDIRLWEKESVARVEFVVMSGKHFFIYHHAGEIMNIITQQLLIPQSKNVPL